jgi:Pentapeptide repeats (8 copies)
MADLGWANLCEVNLTLAVLDGANLYEANLTLANLKGASLVGANLTWALLVETNLIDATLTDCSIYSVSAWAVKLNERTKQQGLIITPAYEPEVTVDDLEVAQFVYLLLHNEKIRRVIDTVTSKVVLILGRFTPERKAVLDAIREELRNRHYVPILFDFDVPAGRDITETVSLLARMARFIIADLTEASSIQKELEAIVPHLAVPVQPLLGEEERPYSMFKDYWKYDWVLPVLRYDGLKSLLATLAERVIAPAEKKMNDLADKRRRFEAELVKPRRCGASRWEARRVAHAEHADDLSLKLFPICSLSPR